MVSRERKIAGISVSMVTLEEGTIWPILYFFIINYSLAIINYFGRCLRPGFRRHTVLASIPNAIHHCELHFDFFDRIDQSPNAFYRSGYDIAVPQPFLRIATRTNTRWCAGGNNIARFKGKNDA